MEFWGLRALLECCMEYMKRSGLDDVRRLFEL